jgi:hypothetical protein
MTPSPSIRLNPSLAAVALVALLALAGCSGRSHTSSTSSSTPPTTSTSTTSQPSCLPPTGTGCPTPVKAPEHFAFNDCSDLILNFEAQPSSIRAEVPPAYQVSNDTVSIVTLEILECQSAVLDNRTVLGRTQLAFLGAAVKPPQQESASGIPDIYALEIFANNATLAKRLNLHGFPAQVAAITTGYAQFPLTATISLTGSPLYSATLIGKSDPLPPIKLTDVLRFHQQVGGIHYWMNFTESKASTIANLEGTLEYSGGALASLPFPPTNPTHVDSTLYASRLVLDFKPET